MQIFPPPLQAVYRVEKGFREKSDYSQKYQVSRWLKRNNFVHRMATHESQKDPRVTVAEALDFLECQRPRLIEPTRHQDYLINMDQTPVPFILRPWKALGRKLSMLENQPMIRREPHLP